MDLKKMFGRRYVVTMEEGWHEDSLNTCNHAGIFDDRWRYAEIKGKCGRLYPYSETDLAVVLPTRAARRLMTLMGAALVLLQHADDAMCFKTDVRNAEAVIRFIKPERARNRGGGLAGERSDRHRVPHGDYPANPPPPYLPSQNDLIGSSSI